MTKTTQGASPQIEAMAIAISGYSADGWSRIEASHQDYWIQKAQAALEASDARYVPVLVEALKVIATMPLEDQDNMNASNLRAVARQALSKLASKDELLELLVGELGA